MTEGPEITERPLWVFGYGSLMWDPGFPVVDRVLARLDGYHRSFCMSSIHHRGTVEDPGLVLALDPAEDGACHGVAFQVPDDEAEATIAYLRERELISSAYLERQLQVRLANGSDVNALVYVVDTEHVQYVGGMPLEEQARIISTAVGGRGPNTEYLWNTVSHLAELGIEDDDLSWLDQRVRELVKTP